MYKESIYNFKTSVILNNINRHVIFNTRTRKLVDTTDCDLSDLTSSQENVLHKNGFLVDTKVDEAQLAQYYRTNKVYQHKLLSLTIIPTADCNFRCIYCYQTSKATYISRGVLDSIVRFLEKNVQYYSTLSISWFGGEPLLCKSDVLFVLESARNICKKYNRLLVSYMTTNGYELDIDFFRNALKNGLRYYQITIDGDSDIHNVQRPHVENNNSFEKIIGNLLAISNSIEKSRFEIGVRVNVSRYSLATMPAFIEKLADLFGADRRFVLIWQWVRDWGGDNRGKELQVSNTVCKELMKDTMDKGMRCYEVLSCNSGTDICEATYKYGYVINFNGKVYKCAMKTFDDPNDEINCIGILDRYGDIKIDETKEMMWLFPSISNNCNECKYYPMCMGNACPYTAVYRNQKTCIVFKNLIPVQIESMYAQHEFFILREEHKNDKP